MLDIAPFTSASVPATLIRWVKSGRNSPHTTLEMAARWTMPSQSAARSLTKTSSHMSSRVETPFRTMSKGMTSWPSLAHSRTKTLPINPSLPVTKSRIYLYNLEEYSADLFRQKRYIFHRVTGHRWSLHDADTFGDRSPARPGSRITSFLHAAKSNAQKYRI